MRDENLDRRRFVGGLSTLFAAGVAGCPLASDTDADVPANEASTDDRSMGTTPTVEPAATLSPTATRGPAETASPATTGSSPPTPTLSPAPTPSATETATPTDSTPTDSPTPTSTPTDAPTPTPTKTPTVSPASAKRFAEDDSPPGRSFGRSVAVSGDTAIVGAEAADTPEGSAAAYVFERRDGEWTQTDRFTPDESGTDLFGWSVAIEGDTTLVGGSDESTNGQEVASVSVYERLEEGWERTDRLVLDEWDSKANFSRALAISGDVAIVGVTSQYTRYEDTERYRPDTGTAYVIERDGATDWAHSATLVPEGEDHDGDETDSPHVAGAAYGYSVGIDDDVAVVGQRSDGDAYVFERDERGWELTAEFSVRTLNLYTYATSLAVSDEVILVSNLFAGVHRGEIQVYEPSEGDWTQTATITATDGMDADVFGRSVALEDTTAIVGAPYDDTADGEDAGSAYQFERGDDGWIQTEKLVAEDGSPNDIFGASVGLSESAVVVGAPVDETSDDGAAGSAYVFDR